MFPVTRFPFTRKSTRLAAAAGVAALLWGAGALAQQAQTAQALAPLPGEVKLTLSLGQRSVAFPAKIEPVARETIPFETEGSAVTAEGREAMTRLQEALLRQPGGGLVIIVYGQDEQLAFQRAKAVRGELAERHGMDAARIISAGRKAEGHSGDLAVVDVFGADPTRCGGCGGSSFRTIALDSAAMGLVTVSPEALATADRAPDAAARSARAPQRAQAAAPARAETQPATRPAAEPPRPPQRTRAAAVENLQPPAASGDRGRGGCPRPRIIIDDYYPGGPMVPCRPTR